MKNSLLIFTFSISLLASAQEQFNEEWIKMDVSIFQHFFKYFPLKPEITLSDLSNNLQRFESTSHNPIGFDGIMHWWVLPGGTVSINSYIVSYNGQIIMAETIIFQDYIKRLNRVFERDRNIEKKFHEFFSLKVNSHDFMDTVYSNIYVNQVAFNKYKNHVAEYLGKQDELDISKCKFEYDLLNNPTGRYGFESFNDLSTNDWTPFYAINKLKNDNRIDCIKNIIRGYSLPGRIYGLVALLQLAKENKYHLTAEDKMLIYKVLNLNLTVESSYGTDIISNRLYKNCVDTDLIKILEK
ncbi:MAG TPA: hypothetical protein VIK14_11575 [Ignavibacteria bacterium]